MFEKSLVVVYTLLSRSFCARAGVLPERCRGAKGCDYLYTLFFLQIWKYAIRSSASFALCELGFSN